jgi:hypothetical protein
MFRLSILSLLILASCSQTPPTLLRPPEGSRPELVRVGLPAPRGSGAYAVDGGGRPIRDLQSGSTLHIGAQGLQPTTLYEFRAELDGQAVSFARAATDRLGRVEPFVLWYESGVVGCGLRKVDGPDRARYRFRTFEEADSVLAGHDLTITTLRVEPGRGRPSELRTGRVESTLRLPVSARRSPMVFPSDSDGCLRNARGVGQGDMYVSGRDFTPGEVLEISVVPNQRAWYVGDRVVDVTGASAAAQPERVTVGSDGRFTVRTWLRAAQFRGAFDIVAQRANGLANRLRLDDLVSFDTETAYLLFLDYPVGGPHMDIAGRPLGQTPYFEFADAFAETSDPAWGAVDPTYVPAGHPGGTYAAYYVVNHKSDAQWTADDSLTDVTPGIEIHQVKAGCVNGTDVVIWSSPLSRGDYDVVVEFGTAVANDAASFSGDGKYNPAVDFLDGAVQIGFQVARDPWELGSIPVGTASYSQDNFFPALGGQVDVDLRGVVRYPAVAPGVNTAVATGTHPLFLIQHGNHSLCTILTDGTPWYTALAAAFAGTMTWSDFSAKQHTWASCPVANREPNHLGYMHLLEVLASHGVIAVSVDAYDLTGPAPGWIDERGQLILKHVELWSHMNNTATFGTYPDFFAGRFAGKVDLTRIGVSGHSRGGEASVSAYMQNAASANPFSITSVSSIAPVDFTGHTLPAVPYFVVLPAADCDVSGLDGQAIYDRAGSGLGDATTKSASYVYGANHNFFNSVWAGDWDDCNPNPARQDFIAPASQQRIGESVLAAFHLSTLAGETVYDDMLRGRLVFPSTAGFKVYATRHETNHARLLSGGTAGLVAAGGATLTSTSNPSPHQTTVTRIGWPGSGATVTFAVPVGQRDATGFEVLAFRVAQTTAAANPANTNQDFQVELVGGGVTRAVYVGQFDVVPPRYPHPKGAVHTVMTTIRVPLHSFIMNSSGLTLSSVDTIRFRFFYPSTGEINVDDVEFSR